MSSTTSIILWDLAKRAVQKVLKKSSKYLVGAFAGYEVHNYVASPQEENTVNREIIHYQGYPVAPENGNDDLNKNDIVILLLIVIIALLVLILLVLGGFKLKSMIAKKAVKEYRAQRD